jgi:hypothetical protein
MTQLTKRRSLEVDPLMERVVISCVTGLAVATVFAVLILAMLGASS